MSPAVKEVILGVTGSIATYKSCDIARGLIKKGVRVIPVMTKEAHEFLTPLTLQTVCQGKVYSDMFAPAEDWVPGHVSLADRAWLVLIAPATANIIGKLAHGICDDLLTCICVSTKAPVLIAPAMNSTMYRNAIVQQNISILKRLGYGCIDPVTGDLACGTRDIGHLAPVERIVQRSLTILKAHARQ